MIFIALQALFLAAGIAAIFSRTQVAVAFVVASMPWQAIQVNIGTSLYISEFLALLFIASRLAFTKGRWQIPAWARTLLLFLAVSSVIGLFNLAGGTTYRLWGASFFQDGIGRILTQSVKWGIWILFAVQIWSLRHKLDPGGVIRAFLLSMAVLSVLGMVQFSVFSATGIDLFPIGGADGRTAVLGGELRITAFAGEPKGFASKLVIAIAVLIALRGYLGLSPARFGAGLALFLSCLALTASSSGFFTFVAMMGAIALMRLRRKPLSRQGFQLACAAAFFGVAASYLGMGLLQDLTALPEYRATSGLLDTIRYQTIERFRLDDTDAVYIMYFLDNPERLFAGLGLGLGHTEAMGHIPWHQERYMYNTTMPPKSGVIEVLVASGLLGLWLFSRGIALSVGHAEDPSTLKMRQTLVLALTVIAALRMYDMFIILTFLSLQSLIRAPVFYRRSREWHALRPISA